MESPEVVWLKARITEAIEMIDEAGESYGSSRAEGARVLLSIALEEV